MTGRFERQGRLVVGSVTIRQQGCAAVRAGFRVPLVGRPNAPHAGVVSICDRVVVADATGNLPVEAYWVFDHNLGCTTAREAARRFHASTACRRPKAVGGCTIRGFVCQRIRGSQDSPLNSVRCGARAPRRFTELRYEAPCAWPGDDIISLWAINVGCTAARTFPVQALLGDDGAGPCGDLEDFARARHCAVVAGFRCTAWPQDAGGWGGFHALCVNVRDRFSALAIDYEFG